MEPEKPIVIWGASGHALVVADIIRLQSEFRIVGLLDDLNHERTDDVFHGMKVLGGVECLDRLRIEGTSHLIIGFGDCSARIRLAQVAKRHGFQLARAIHPSAVIAGDVVIGEGSVIAAGAVVNPGSLIGENVVINTCASIDHECRVATGAHICPGVRLAGRVSIGCAAHVGIGSIVKEGVRIGASSIIGAGSVVLRDIPDNVVAYGNPARVIRTINAKNSD